MVIKAELGWLICLKSSIAKHNARRPENILDLFKAIFYFVLCTMVNHHQTTVGENVFLFCWSFCKCRALLNYGKGVMRWSFGSHCYAKTLMKKPDCFVCVCVFVEGSGTMHVEIREIQFLFEFWDVCWVEICRGQRQWFQSVFEDVQRVSHFIC